MQGQFCRFYVHESDRHHGQLLWEWLLEQASRLGIRGGSAFKAMAGFGSRHVLHEDRFFELAGSLAIEVEFIVTEKEVASLLDLLHRERINAFYALIPARFGVTGTEPPQG
jgi:PII-like signaling protein